MFEIGLENKRPIVSNGMGAKQLVKIKSLEDYVELLYYSWT